MVLDPVVEDKIKQMTVNFSYMHLLYQHFSRLCSMVHFVPGVQPLQTLKVDYSKTLKSTAWLIFVLMRSLRFTEADYTNTRGHFP